MRLERMLAMVVLAGICGAAGGASFTVTNGTDVGFGTLREAIQLANSSPGKDMIDFQIPPTGVPATIQPTNYLPLITDSVMIDGWSQLGAADCQPGIEIDGSLAGSGNGLSLWVTTNCEIKGLCINRFNGNGIIINQGGNHRIYGCFIGTDITGTNDYGNTNDGIVVVSSTGNHIGELPTYSCTNRNIISGNGQNGVQLTTLAGGACSLNILQNNHIGTDVNGSYAIPNDRDGVRIDDTNVTGNSIGSIAAPKPVNVISGNRTNGVYIYLGGNNDVLGNSIGVNRLGALALANGRSGVVITNASSCSVGDSSGEARNIIAGNGDDGVDILGSAAIGNMVQGNYIGLGTNGFAAIPNGDDGVVLASECTQNLVGDNSGTLGRNVISGNDGCGVRIERAAFGNFVLANYIGVNRLGIAAVENREHGVLLVDGATGNNIGDGSITSSGNLISGNGVSNLWHGVCIASNANDNLVDGNVIGLGANNLPVANYGDGVHVEGAHSNMIGSLSAAGGNVISGNYGDGVQIGPGASYNEVYQDWIGLDTNGTSARGNGGEGVHIYRTAYNAVGTNYGPRNVISGNGGSGVLIDDNSSSHDNTVVNNYIGTDVAGGAAVGNSDHGVRISGGVSNMVGTVVAGNLISGNANYGVRLDSLASYNQLNKNLIGVNPSSSAALSNGHYGVYVSGSPRNLIGQPGGRGNVISGNGDDGIHILGANSVSNSIRANSIGADGTWAIAIGNTGNGVWIGTSACGNWVGGTNAADANFIGNNGDCGVRILTGTNNAVLGNMIVSNRNLGIDLGPTAGVTFNDVIDPDTGANFFQNFPVLHEATTGSVTVAGFFNSRPSATYRLEFFRCDALDALGYGEGRSLIGATNVTTDASGTVLFEAAFAMSVPTGAYVTATATDPFGNTSEFSRGVPVVPTSRYGDADGDGMPTWWEEPNHLDPYDNSGTNGAAGDPDGDDVNNYDEYVADTAPSDPDNYLHMVDIDIPSNTLVAYTSTNTRYYTVHFTTNIMETAPWTDLYALSVPGSNGVTTADDASASTIRLYRVEVQLTP